MVWLPFGAVRRGSFGRHRLEYIVWKQLMYAERVESPMSVILSDSISAINRTKKMSPTDGHVLT